jgi:hypothetical protein
MPFDTDCHGKPKQQLVLVCGLQYHPMPFHPCSSPSSAGSGAARQVDMGCAVCLQAIFFYFLKTVFFITQIKDTSYPYVSIDDYAAAQSAVNFLIRAGRNKIAFLNGPKYFKYAKDRLRGFKDAMDTAELFVPSSWIIIESIEDNGISPRSALLSTEMIIRESAIAAGP